MNSFTISTMSSVSSLYKWITAKLVSLIYCVIVDIRNVFSQLGQENEHSAVHDVTGTVNNILTNLTTSDTKSFKYISSSKICKI